MLEGMYVDELKVAEGTLFCLACAYHGLTWSTGVLEDARHLSDVCTVLGAFHKIRQPGRCRAQGVRWGPR